MLWGLIQSLQYALEELGPETENCKKILFPSTFSAEISTQRSQLYQWELIIPTSKDDVTDKEALWNLYKNRFSEQRNSPSG